MNIELCLITKMLETGDFGPIIRGEIKESTFGTSEGKVLFNFITTYRRETDGTAVYPSLNVVRSRWPEGTMELPDLDPGDTVANLTHETLTTKFKSDVREISAGLQLAVDSASSPLEAVIPFLTKLRKATEVTTRSPHLSFANGLYDVVDNYADQDILPDGISWPWPSLTDATKGIRRQELVVFAGRPKSRKTFTAFRAGIHAFKNEHKRVLIFSPEMPVRQCMLRCVAHYCDLPYTEFKNSHMAMAEERRLAEAAETYGLIKGDTDETYQWRLQERFPELRAYSPQQMPSLDIVQSTGRDTLWMASQIEIYQPDLVIADSFYRQRPEGGRKNDSDWKAVTALSREIKDLAMHTNVAFIGTHQLNRGAEKGVGGLDNMALADAVGQDADAIFRVITGKIEGQDVSALYTLGAREIAFDGVLINNKPCYDYSERAKITNIKQVLDLMKQEDEAAAKDEQEKKREEAAEGQRKRENARGQQMRKGTGTKIHRTGGLHRACAQSPYVDETEQAAAAMGRLLPQP